MGQAASGGRSRRGWPRLAVPGGTERPGASRQPRPVRGVSRPDSGAETHSVRARYGDRRPRETLARIAGTAPVPSYWSPWRSGSWLACPGRSEGAGDQSTEFHGGAEGASVSGVLFQAQDRADLGKVQAVEVAQGQDLAVDGIELRERCAYHLATFGAGQRRIGPRLGIDQVLGQRHHGAVRPGDVAIHVVLRPQRPADHLPETVENLPVNPGIEVVRLGRERLPPWPGAEERLLNHSFRVNPHSQLAADSPTDHRQQPRAQTLEGFGEDGLPCQEGESRL